MRLIINSPISLRKRALALAAVAAIAASPDLPNPRHAKFVFLFIGDGMAMPQISSAEVFAKAMTSQDIAVKRLGFTQFPVAGLPLCECSPPPTASSTS